jgi:hypothetical protein
MRTSQFESGTARTPRWGGLVLLLVGVGMSVSSCEHDPAPGPLAPPKEERVAENISGFRAEVGESFTFGLLFIKNYGDHPAVLDGVELVDPSEGIELGGSRVVDVTGDHRTWSSSETFPPKRPVGQQALDGFKIAPNEEVVIQVLLEVELTEQGRHGFREVAVLYRVGEEEFRYEIASGVVACTPGYYEESGRKSCRAEGLFQP